MEKSSKRTLLIIKGVRQIGKTYTALMNGKKYYKNMVYFNMEDSQELVTIFEKDFDIERIITELSIRSGESIFKNETFIIFDEIQACERVLLSLKYFCEKST